MKIIFKTLRTLIILLVIAIILIVVLFGHADIPLEELKAKYANEHSQFMPLNGMEVHYRDEGNKQDSLPIILIHGTGASLHTFNDWAASLKENHRVIRMDLPAYGLTGPFPDGNYNIEHYVDFLNGFLNQLRIDQCIIAGNSLGGQIAWRYTAAYPDKVNKLILIDAAGYTIRSKSVPPAFKAARIPVIKNLFTYITPRSVAKASVENVYYDQSKVTEELVDRYFELTLRDGNRQAFVDRFSASYDTTAVDFIKAIQQPTLVMWGKQDDLIPVYMAEQFHQDLPNDTLVILDKAGHVPMEEIPERSLEVVREFLKQ
ncbi:alpha/beta hydrolase [Marivirga atlantica]|jgi:pimeloyl-ACP methyl ester carboxylesterase|uniref:Alpha/beta hydrolase n=1 Tax=Marivirga atlantica TaxID=1548457 RepID=A0A937ADW0_9BACT|nr:alpha/beta hydrolase [Marivirga atlantica]MBL0764729.1 alpha/beta hydrolase [Marivirga atlantica]